MFNALKRHWPEYLMEGAGLGMFMISASVLAVVLFHPASPSRYLIVSPFLRRVLMGIGMGLTAIGLIYSPWGKQSGAHFNPGVTLSFFWLGKVDPWDAVFYIVAQFLGGLAGILLVVLFLNKWLSDPSVNYIVTIPGPSGPGIAFVAEFIISFGLMFAVLLASTNLRWSSLTGVLAGILLAIYIGFEAPLSGTSMNPARTFASALAAHLWTAVWVYLTAPLLGMLAAAQTYLWRKGSGAIFCAKLHHNNTKRCIFWHGYGVDRSSAVQH